MVAGDVADRVVEVRHQRLEVEAVDRRVLEATVEIFRADVVRRARNLVERRDERLEVRPVDRASAVDNLRRILERADDFFVRLDMESSQYTETTLAIFETLWQQNYRNIGVVLQADLYRTEQDLERFLALGARIRAYISVGPIGPLAIVASTDRSYGQARMFTALAEADRPIRIFRELHAARRWLDSLERFPT